MANRVRRGWVALAVGGFAIAVILVAVQVSSQRPNPVMALAAIPERIDTKWVPATTTTNPEERPAP